MTSLHKITDNPPKRKSNLSHKQRVALTSILSDKSIRLDPADKTSTIIITDVVDYNTECNSHLESNTYKVLSMNEAYAHLKRFNSKITTLWKEFFHPLERTSFPYQYVITQGLNTDTFCGFHLLWKDHKPTPLGSKTPPGRPVCSNINYTSCAASKWIDYTLQPLVKRLPTVLHSSLHLVRDVETSKFNTHPNITLASQDVSALYPNIPIDFGVSAVESVLKDHPEVIPPPDVPLIIATLLLVLKYCILNWDSRYFKQMIGTAMGTPCAVVFAQIFMFALERNLVNTFIAEGKLLAYKRFIDDLFAIFTALMHAREFITAFNNLHPNIKISGDIGNSVVFMDLCVNLGTRFQKSGLLDLSLHQKKSNAYMYLTPNTFHSKAAKIAFVVTELQRMVINNSEPKTFAKDRLLFYQRLRFRGHQRATLRPAFGKVIYADRQRLIFKPTNVSSTPLERPIVLKTQSNPLINALNIPHTLHVHFDLISKDEEAKQFFSKPITSYRNPVNINGLIRRLRKRPPVDA